MSSQINTSTMINTNSLKHLESQKKKLKQSDITKMLTSLTQSKPELKTSATMDIVVANQSTNNKCYPPQSTIDAGLASDHSKNNSTQHSKKHSGNNKKQSSLIICSSIKLQTKVMLANVEYRNSPKLR